jgi:hypothetical protein
MNMSESHKKIIIAPLDWGYGHATRMLSVVRWLSERYDIFIAIPESHRFLFENEQVRVILTPGLNIRFSRMPLLLSMFFQLPKIFIRGLFTRLIIKRAIKKLKPDLIISDNQPLIRSRRVKSVYITHQVSIQHKNRLLKKLFNFAHHHMIHRFDECWVPDTENNDFAGELSMGKLKIPVKYIGGLSRFQTTEENQSEKYRKVCILSGPEPEKTRWANQIKRNWKNEKGALIIGVLKGKDRYNRYDELTLASHLSDGVFMSIIKQADEIVSRSGYSTIMDLAYLGKKATLISTKGQTEQEYLAEFYKDNDISDSFAVKESIIDIVRRVLIC